MWPNDNRKLDDLRAELEELRRDLAKFREQRAELDPKLVSERLADLEVKMSKLWALLLETSPTSGREKLTKYGKMFGGRAKQL